MDEDKEIQVAEEILKEVSQIIVDQLKLFRPKLEEVLQKESTNPMIMFNYLAGYDKAIMVIEACVTKVEG